MATLPTRTTASFDAIKPVSSLVLLDNEFNQYVGAAGFLNGNSTGTKLLVKSSDALDPPIEIDQTGAGPLAEWKQSGTLKASINNAGELVLANALPVVRLTNTANTDSVRFDMGQPQQWRLVNEDLATASLILNIATDVFTFAQQPILPRSKTAWSVSWLYNALPGAVETTESVGRFIVPAGQDITITDITSVWAAGADSLAANLFNIKRRNAAGALQADIGNIDVNSGAQDVLNVNNVADVPLTAGDQIYPLFTTRNTASEQLVTITVRGTQGLVA